MKKKNHLSILLLAFIISVSYGQGNNSPCTQIKSIEDSIGLFQIKTDSFFNSKQMINLLVFPKDSYNKFGIEFGYSHTDLLPTSSFAKSENVLAAINGGFFNMDSGGSVSYFEVNDELISRKRNPDLKWGISDSLMNGAIVISKDSRISIQPVNSEHFYDSSKLESAVLVTGPLLLLNSEAIKLAERKFVTDRHPRTCLCETEESVVFITIDGRREEAEGMSLIEVQKFLMSIECIDGINLDGGGSTTMWVKDKGIVNSPSDESGERPVANVLMITDKSSH
ncbi:MAG: phosphodiester glycosidase family protein [Bacteroidales bacterium]|nr:phosphodiester glycosidase family protein [Bacteroidales bacterium]MCF8405498.1 phosphodiester glycosidase family protein [Bacteroidales bacterium]